MQLRTAGLLYDIRQAAQFITEDTSGATFESFMANRRLRQVVERNITIIAEAINRLYRHDPETARRLSETSQIIGMRSLLIHAYETIDYIQNRLANGSGIGASSASRGGGIAPRGALA